MIGPECAKPLLGFEGFLLSDREDNKMAIPVCFQPRCDPTGLGGLHRWD
jgi:hypothetical protein